MSCGITYRHHPFSGTSFCLFLLALFFLVMKGCTGSGEAGDSTGSSENLSSAGIPAYPAWFLHPGSISEENAVGFAMASFYEERAAERAFHNGELAFRAQQGLIISYTTFWEQLPDDSFRLTGEEFLTDTLAAPAQDLHLADFATVNRMTISLVSASDAITLHNNRVHPGPQPNWVRNPPVSGDYAYAVGYSPVYYYEHESWKRAEISALKNLAQDYEIRHQRLVRSLNGASEAITLQESELRVGEIQVLERWRDERNSYVLIRANRGRYAQAANSEFSVQESNQ
ncbi:MAG: hypothetical protein LAT84_08800 [Balneolia bacterium]|nr:hypothetical protein [Balneolia bacterium]